MVSDYAPSFNAAEWARITSLMTIERARVPKPKQKQPEAANAILTMLAAMLLEHHFPDGDHNPDAAAMKQSEVIQLANSFPTKEKLKGFSVGEVSKKFKKLFGAGGMHPTSILCRMTLEHCERL